ncbi:MAG TPA: carbon-nitrogen hydrolase family protein [Gemmatimonadales bacterium]|nr:carbon-nitrogen hydrolase family protein [Gemmatimonadales bacterium]
MRVTVCELPDDTGGLEAAWDALVRHTAESRAELVLLPEFAGVEAIWESSRFDAGRWAHALAQSDAWLARLGELGAAYVVGSRPVGLDQRRWNQGYCWSAEGGVTALRSKAFLPAEAGGWESAWFDAGERSFPLSHAGPVAFGLNICTELWALESYTAYAELGADLVLAPRATARGTTAKWLAVGIVAAVRAGAFSVSSNRADPSGRYGGTGWIIGPDGDLLARTTADVPFATVDLELARSALARRSYPRNVLAGEGVRACGEFPARFTTDSGAGA